jgi:hypothetical protein
MNRDLYDVARQINHEYGFDWTDPRTMVTHKAPKKKRPKKRRKVTKRRRA